MTEPIATLVLLTRDPLRAGKTQSLALRLSTRGHESLYIRFPVGAGGSALMAQREFARCMIDFSGTKPRGVIGLERDPDISGLLRIGLRRPDDLLVFDIALEDFLVDAVPGSAELTLHAESPTTPALASVKVAKTATRPEIRAFTASRYNVISGARVPLSWTLSEDAAYALFSAKQADALLTGQGAAGRSPAQPKGNYTLKVLLGDEVVDSRQLRIHGFARTGFGSYELDLPAASPPIAGILGLYAHPNRGRLYALLRAAGDTRLAQLWSSSHGFETESWQPETNATGERITIPIAAARRPGAIIHDRLWLMGGDCCDPDAPGRDTGYYDFQQNVWHEVADTDARGWRTGMATRMGHALVALPSGDRLWLMGGWRQDGGPCGDMWEFDGSGWTRLEAPCDLCLFGAVATETGVWSFGGFAEPGGAGCLTVTSHDLAGKTAVDTDVGTVFGQNPMRQYCASSLFALDPSRGPSGVALLFANRAYSPALFFMGSEQMKLTFQKSELAEETAVGVLIPRDYSHIQSAVFQGAVFFRSLLPDRDARLAPQINYLVKVNWDK